MNETINKTMSSNTYKILDDVLFQKVDDETVILEPETGHYFTLDAIGTFMVEHLQKGLSFEEVIGQVLAVYDVKETEAQADLQTLISEMKESGLLKQQV